MLRRVIRSALYTFKLTIVADGPRPARRGDGSQRRPILVLSRHAGPGDSMLLMNGLVNNYGRKPWIVLKEFLQWDPAVDVILNRLPATFVPVGRKGGEQLLAAISDLTRDMGPDDSFVIFPEGAKLHRKAARAGHRQTEGDRQARSRRAGGGAETDPASEIHRGADRARRPRPTMQVWVFVGHAGLEAFHHATRHLESHADGHPCRSETLVLQGRGPT